MNRQLSIIILSLFFLTNCQKEPCERNKTGTITISNSSSNPYDIYVDSSYEMQLPGNSISGKIELREGNGRPLYAEQVSGFIFFPTEKTKGFNVVRCSDYSWQIP